MVSEVIITGLKGVPEWAKESTVLEMLRQITNLVELTSEQKKDIRSSLDQARKTGKITKDQARKISGGDSNMLGALTTGLKDTATGAVESAAGLDKLPGPLKKFGASIKNASTFTKTFALSVGFIGNQIGKAIATVRENVSVLRDLSDSGIQMQGSFLEVQKNLAATGMTLAEFGEMASKYSRVLGVNGFNAITKLTKSVNAADKGFATYGLTTAEATEFTAEFLEQQRMAGIFGGIQRRGQAQALKENIERLTAYSKILNVSRKQMMETTKSMLDREDLQRKFFTMEVEDRVKAQDAFKTTIQGFASFGPAGDKFAEMLTDMAAAPVAENSEAFKRLAAASPQLAKDMAALSRSMMDGNSASREEITAMLKRAGANKQLIDRLALAGGELEQMVNIIASVNLAIEEGGKKETKLREDYEKERQEGFEGTFEKFLSTVDKNVKTATALDDAMAKFQATIEYTRVKAFVDLLGGEGTKAIDLAIKAIDAMTAKMMKFNEGDMMANAGKWIHDNLGLALLAAGVALTAFSGIVSGVGIILGGFGLGLKGTLGIFGKLTKLGPSIGLPGKGLAGAARFAGGAAAVGAAGYLGYKAGGLIYEKFLQDKFAPSSFKDYDPNSKILSPEQQDQFKKNQELKAAMKARQKVAGRITTTPTKQSAIQTTPDQTPDIETAKLSAAERTALASEKQVKLLSKLVGAGNILS